MSNACALDPKSEAELLPLLTPSEVAKALKTTPQTILRWEKAGKIPAEIKEGRIVRFVLANVKEALRPKKGGVA